MDAGTDDRGAGQDVLGASAPCFAPRASGHGAPAREYRRLGSELMCGSPCRARRAAVVLGHVGTRDDADVLTRALDDDAPLVREHAARALAPIEQRAGPSAARRVRRTACAAHERTTVQARTPVARAAPPRHLPGVAT